MIWVYISFTNRENLLQQQITCHITSVLYLAQPNIYSLTTWQSSDAISLSWFPSPEIYRWW